MLDIYDELFADESGMGTIEVVLILVVLVGLVILFKGKIQALLNTVFGEIDSQSAQVYGSGS